MVFLCCFNGLLLVAVITTCSKYAIVRDEKLNDIYASIQHVSDITDPWLMDLTSEVSTNKNSEHTSYKCLTNMYVALY